MSLPARLFALGLCLAMPALAQGQPVKPAGGLTDCPVAVAPVRFCEADTGFHRMPQAINPDVNAFYEHSTGAAGMLIVETVGTADGLTLQMVRQNLIQNLADGGGVTTDAVLVWPEQTASVAGTTLPTMVYSGPINGTRATYANTVLLAPERLIQLITVNEADSYTPLHLHAHSEFLAHIRIDP